MILLDDLRYAVRTLRKEPGFAVAAVATLALGIGANCAIFSVVRGVLLRSLPYPDPDRLAIVTAENPSRGFERYSASPPNFLDLREQNRTFSGMAAYLGTGYALTGEGEAEQVDAVIATPDLFAVVGVAPLLGRTFVPEEGTMGRDRVAVLAHGFWQRRFGGDRGAVGRTVRLDGEDYRVIGVMPPGFAFPLSGCDLWTPLAFGPDVATQRGAHYLTVVARLAPGVSLERARTDLSGIARRLEAAYPDKNQGWGVAVTPLAEMVVGRVRSALLVLLGAVALVALIACANVASLLLARAAGREGEVAVRVALGAPRGRLVRQMLTETAVLALLAAGVAVLLAAWAVDAIVRLGPADLPRLAEVRLDGAVLAFTGGLALAVALLCGLLPALRASRPAAPALSGAAGRTAGGRSGNRLRAGLVVGEIALALTLLAGAGLMLRSFLGLTRVDPGFDASRVLAFDLSLPESRYPDGERIALFYDELAARLAALPGVRSAAAVWGLPLRGADFSSSFTVDGEPPEPPGEERSAEIRGASPDYFETLRIPLRKGRLFDARDRRGAPPAVLVSETAARRFWPAGDAIGKRLTLGARPGNDRLGGEVVGIVADVRDVRLDAPPAPVFYVPLAQSGSSYASLVLRTSSSPAALARAARSEVAALDPDLPVSGLATLEEVVAAATARPRFYASLLAVFAGVALALAAVGIYGVVSYAVSRRTREIGIRMALGAPGRRVLALVLRQGLALALFGVALGLAAALGATRLLAGLLFGVSATDGATFGAVALLLAAAALLASWLPARRAARLDPAACLRRD